MDAQMKFHLNEIERLEKQNQALREALNGFVNALSHIEKNNIPNILWDKAQRELES